MGLDIQHGGAASYFPEEPGLDQSGRQALAVPWGQHRSPPGQAAPPLKRQRQGLGERRASCRVVVRGAGPPGGSSLPATAPLPAASRGLAGSSMA